MGLVPGFADNSTKWVKQLFENNSDIFATNYEAAVFEKWIRKFAPERAEKIQLQQIAKNQYTLSLPLKNHKAPYLLTVLTNDRQQIIRIGRKIQSAETTGHSNLNEWLSRFIYFIDSADTNAMYDLTFSTAIKIQYDGLTDKRKIFRQFYTDFNDNVVVNQAKFSRQLNNHILILQTQHLPAIILQLPENINVETESYVYQNQLIESLIRFYTTNSQSKNDSLKTIKNDSLSEWVTLKNYPRARLTGKNEGDSVIVIPYPQNRLQSIKTLRFGKLPGQEPSLRPEISLAVSNQGNHLILNDSHPVKLDSITADWQDRKFVRKWEQRIASQFFIWMTGEPDAHVPADEDFSATVKIHGFDKADFVFASPQQFVAFYRYLGRMSTVYYFPSRITQKDNRLILNGIIYLYPDGGQSNFYNFAEVRSEFLDSADEKIQSLSLEIFTFIRDDNVANIWAVPEDSAREKVRVKR